LPSAGSDRVGLRGQRRGAPPGLRRSPERVEGTVLRLSDLHLVTCWPRDGELDARSQLRHACWMFPETQLRPVSGNGPTGWSMDVSGNSSHVTSRVRRHRANAGLIRVEVEVPTAEDAHVVRRFAQARRRAAEGATVHEATAEPAATAGEGPDVLLADLDDASITTKPRPGRSRFGCRACMRLRRSKPARRVSLRHATARLSRRLVSSIGLALVTGSRRWMSNSPA